MIDGMSHPCYDHTAAGLMLSSIPEPTVPPPSGSRTAIVLLVSTVLTVAGLVAVWLWWVR